MPDWKKIKAEYVRGGTSYRKLAEKYGVSFSSLKTRAKREDWTDLRTQKERKFDTILVDKAATREAERSDKILDITDKLLDQIIEAMEDGSIGNIARGYKDITGALKDLRELKSDKFQRDLQEQQARIDKLNREAKSDSESKDISVVISEELEDYAK